MAWPSFRHSRELPQAAQFVEMQAPPLYRTGGGPLTLRTMPVTPNSVTGRSWSSRRPLRGRFHDPLLGGLGAAELGGLPALAQHEDAVRQRQQFRQLARRDDDAQPLA